MIYVTDISKVAAKVLTETDKHLNKAYELTNNEIFSVAEMAAKLNSGLNTNIIYEFPNLFKFFVAKRKKKYLPC